MWLYLLEMSQGHQKKAVPVLSSPCFVHLSGEGILTYSSALGRTPEFKGWPGRVRPLLRSGAPSNEQMKTKEDERRVGAELLTLSFYFRSLAWNL